MSFGNKTKLNPTVSPRPWGIKVIPWVVPLPSNNHHQEYYIFSRGWKKEDVSVSLREFHSDMQGTMKQNVLVSCFFLLNVVIHCLGFACSMPGKSCITYSPFNGGWLHGDFHPMGPSNPQKVVPTQWRFSLGSPWVADEYINIYTYIYILNCCNIYIYIHILTQPIDSEKKKCELYFPY